MGAVAIADEVEARLFAHVCAHLVACASAEEASACADLEPTEDPSDLLALFRERRAARDAGPSRDPHIRFSVNLPPKREDEQLSSARWLVSRDPYLALLDKAVGDLDAVLSMAGVKRCPGKPLSDADKERLCDYARFYWPERKRAEHCTPVSKVPPAAEHSVRDDLKRRLTAAFNAFSRNPTETNRDALTALTDEFCYTRPKRSGKHSMVSAGAVDSNRRRH